MFNIEIKFPNGTLTRYCTRETSLLIGKHPNCKLKLKGWRMGQRHVELFISNERVFARDLGSLSGTQVNGVKISTAGPLHTDDVITAAGHEIRVRWFRRLTSVKGGVGGADGTVVDASWSKGPVARGASTLGGTDRLTAIEEARLSRAAMSVMPKIKPQLQPQPHQKQAQKPQQPQQPPSPPEALHRSVPDEFLRYRKVLQEQLVQAFSVRRTDVHRMADAELRALTEKIITELMDRSPEIPNTLDRHRLLAEVRDESIGLGLLEPLLADASVTEIMVNAADEVFVERSGKLERVPLAFTSNQAVLGIIERIVAPMGRRIDESSPMVDARLKDGSRVNAIISPLTLKGPALTIRKFSKRKLSPQDLLEYGSLSAEMLEFLRVCVMHKKNIIISGGTGSGKTTLLNVLTNFISPSERIVTIEDAAELQLHHPNLVSLEARPANIEGKGQVAIRELLKNALRMRPDRIVVGECRGGEALDMLQAMNTGHDGSLTTAHANSPRDMLSRLEVMVLMAGIDLPLTAIREQVASAVHVIVQQSRLPCGTRKVTHIVEVTGIEAGTIQLQEIFAYVQEGLSEHGQTRGYFCGRGCVPEFYEKLLARGLPLDRDIFGMSPFQGNNMASRRAA